MAAAPLFKFRQYVTGNTPNSAQAKVNLNRLCRLHLHGRYEIEVVDVSRDPARALRDQIYMTPSLMRVAPSPVCMIVGTLSNPELWLQALGLAPSTT
jgi:circadian clock protein KaiB